MIVQVFIFYGVCVFCYLGRMFAIFVEFEL